MINGSQTGIVVNAPAVSTLNVSGISTPPDSYRSTIHFTSSYDASGRLQSIADPLHTVTFGYDGANRPTSSTLPDLNVISASYDGNSNLLSLTPPGRTVHVFSYQGGDLEQDYTPPAVDLTGTGHMRTNYDLDRAVTSVVPDGVPSITPGYDVANGRLLSLVFSAGSNSYSYVPSSGRLASITAPDGNKVSYTYDGPLLLTTTFSGSPAAGTVTRTYDADFRLATEAVTGGQSITFQYDNDSLLTAAGALSITRSPATGFVTGTTLGSVTDSRTYDSFGAEQTYSASFGASSLYSVDYGTRDALGRIVTKTETVLGAQQVYGYTYDARGRLTDVTKNAAPLSHYGYDANGNRIAGPGLTASPSYDAQDRLTSYGACAYGYKADGSLQMKTCSNGTTTYDFDAFGNLRNVALPNGTHIEYVIDGQNRRVGKKVCATAINVSCPASSLVEGFLYRNQLQPAAWLDGAGAVRRPMPGTDRGLLQATREKIPNARQTWILDRGERVLLFPVIAAALQPKAIFVGAAVWIGVSNGGAETLRACVTSVGEQRGRGGKFNADMHACRADDQFVALRPGDSYLFLQSRIGRRSSKYFLSVFVSQGTESASRVEVEVNTSSKLQVRGHPKARAVKAARVDNLIVIENGSDSPLAISTVTNGCKDSDSSKMLLLGHNRLTVSTQLSLDEIAVFDPAKPCKRIGAATIGRRQSD